MHVRIADMPLIRTWMYCDALGPELLCFDGRLGDTRQCSTAAVAQGCYLVDIDTQLGMGHGLESIGKAKPTANR
jgi:hypothetical protein